MSKFQPEFEKLEPRQLLAADWGAAEAALPLGTERGEVYVDEYRFPWEATAEEICFEAALWEESEGVFTVLDHLAERLLADANAWSVESQVQTDEELIFAEGESLESNASDIVWLVG